MYSWQKNKLWKEQKRFIMATAIIGFFLPGLLFLAYVLLHFLFNIFWVIALPALFFCFIWIKAISTENTFLESLRDYCTFIPYEYLEKESLLEKKFNATYALILINVAIHYGIEIFGTQARDVVTSYLAFFPDHLHFWNIFLSPLTSNFLHADSEHLWFNMIFLWIFGLVLERRIGWKKFLFIYLGTGAAASIIPAYLNIVLFQDLYSSIGASGAISGIMGAFAFRLFYKRMVFPIPILGIFSVLFGLNLKVRINSLMVIMTYFFYDFLGSLFQLSGELLAIDHLAHLSGMLMGMYLASKMKFHDEAIEEMILERAMAAVDEKGNNQSAEKLLRLLLEKNPERVEALVLLARIVNRFRPNEEGQKLYLKAIDLLIDKKPELAAEIFAEYFGVYPKPLEPAKQFKLTEVLEKTGRARLAARALEMLADDKDTPQIWRPRILFRAARILEKLGLYEAACYRYEQLLEKFPDFKEAELVRFKLEKLKTACSDTTWTSLVQKKFAE